MYHLLVLLILCSAINGQQEVFLTNYEWGTSQDEFITSAAYHTQSDVIYTAGYTYGNMQGTNKGSTDVVVSILPLASGPLNVQWGTPWEDRPTDIVYDIKRNLIHVVGWTSGVLAGDKSAGVEDGFITTLTVQGPSATTDHYQWGTAGSDKPMCAAVDPQDATTIYVAGTTSGAFTGYSNKGSEDVFVSVKHSNNSFSHYQWGTKAVDVVGDCVFDTTTGAFYIVGSTVGALPGFNNSGGYDPFATVLLRNGEIRHIQWGTAYSEFVTGAVYNTRLKALMVVGYTNGAFTDTSSRGAQDAFLSVISFKDDGSYSISDHQWGTIGNDVPTDVSTDIVYNRIYVSGYTSGQFIGATSAGGTDAFMSVFAAANPEYPPNTFQWGTNGTDQCVAIAQSSSNPNVYCAGWTTGGFPTSQGVTGGTQLFASGLRKELLPTPFVEESSSEPDGLISNSNRVQTNFVLFGVVVYIYYLL